MTNTPKPTNWKIFSSPKPHVDDVHLSWFHVGDPWFIAEAYIQAAKAMPALAADKYISRDNAFFPCAFLFRHAFELALKAIIADGCLLFSEDFPSKLKNEHDLKTLWEKARSIIVKIWDDDPETLDPIDEIIIEYSRVDPNGQTFRYEKTLQGKSMTASLPEQISLHNIADRSSKLFDFLNGCHMGICAAIDARNESYE